MGYVNTNSEIRIGTTNGKEIPVYGGVCLPFELNDVKFQHTVLLTPADAFPGDLLLGVDWLTKLGTVQFNFKEHTVNIEGYNIPFRTVLATGLAPRIRYTDKLQLTSFIPVSEDDGIEEIREGPEMGPIRLDHLTPEEREQIKRVWEANSPAVSQSETDLGCCELVSHQIRTGDQMPVVKKQYPIPHAKKELMESEINKMLKMDVIEACQSPWRSPVLLVQKKNAEGQKKDHRFAVDFRDLNERVPKDKFPLPRIETILEALRGASVFSSLDLKSGYWQVPVAPEDRDKTAFSCGWATFRFKRMPFGLHNAPATFQRLMQRVLHKVLNVCALVYLDDIIVFSKNFEDHLAHLNTVLKLLGKHGLKVSPAKCHLAKAELKFLGHQVSGKGIEVDTDKVKAIREMPPPTDKRGIRGFIGMASYYRKFIPEFSEVAAPLTALTKKDARFKWLDEHQKAFDTLKIQLSSAPVLAYPQYDRIYKLQTDASHTALGAVLTQEENGIDRPISYYSRKLNDAETRYTVTEKEALAIVAAVKHFAAYLYGKKFIILTDHAPLRYIFQYKATVPRITRWAVVLAQFDYEIIYKPGKAHLVPDALSRNVAAVMVRQEQYRNDPAQIFEPVRVRAAQLREPEYCALIGALEDGAGNTHNPGVGDRFCLQEGCLYYAEKLEEEGRLRLVVPHDLKNEALKIAHDTTLGGHFGVEKTYHRTKTMFYWKTQISDVQAYVKSCDICQRRNPRGQLKAGIGRLPPANEPLERVGIDLIGKLSPSLRGNHYILTIVCHFSRFVQAYAIPNKRTETVANRFLDFVCRYGTPQHVVSDRGSEFTSRVFQDMLNRIKAKTHLTCAYHPQSNGLTEVFNKLLKNTIIPMVQQDPRTWDDQLPCAVFALNSSYHPSIRNSPYFLMHGRDPPLPYSQLLGPQRLHYGLTDGDPEAIYQRLQKAFRSAREASDEAHELNVKYQSKPSARVYTVGDVVFLRNEAAMRGSYSKFATHWIGPFRISRVVTRVNVEIYAVFDDRRKPQIVHVDRLKPAHVREGTPYITKTSADEREHRNAYNLSERARRAANRTTQRPSPQLQTDDSDVDDDEDLLRNLRTQPTEATPEAVEAPGGQRDGAPEEEQRTNEEERPEGSTPNEAEQRGEIPPRSPKIIEGTGDRAGTKGKPPVSAAAVKTPTPPIRKSARIATAADKRTGPGRGRFCCSDRK